MTYFMTITMNSLNGERYNMYKLWHVRIDLDPEKLAKAKQWNFS